jgi:hypothetical protein
MGQNFGPLKTLVSSHSNSRLEMARSEIETIGRMNRFQLIKLARQVIMGWDEGCLGMAVGEVAKLTCSPDYAYGAAGFPAWGIPPNAVLTFDIEILKIA